MTEPTVLTISLAINDDLHATLLACYELPSTQTENNQGETTMAQLVVMYKTPRDAAAFDKHYAEKHIPIAKKIPGL